MKASELNNTPGVYTITNLINNKIYVGCAFKIKRRIRAHYNSLKNNKHRNGRLQNSWNKYGKENFIFEILEECTIDLIYSQECFWINMLDSCNSKYGYNINSGNPYNKPTIYRCTGEKNYFFGKKGELSPMFGKKGNKQSKEWIQNSANTRKRKVNQLTLKGVFIKEWAGLRDIEKTLNIKNSNISLCCSKSQKTAGGFKWEYATNEPRKKRKYSMIKNRKPILQFDLENNFIKEWSSIADGARALNLTASHIGSCCLGKRNTHGNFKWKYKT